MDLYFVKRALVEQEGDLAAGQKFGNLPRDIDNADRGSGFIVSARKGVKQLTTRGEAVAEDEQ